MDFEKITHQLAKPEGPMGIKVAEGMNTINQFISKSAYNLLQLHKNENLLEIGMGNGKLIEFVLDLAENIRYTGVDLSRTMVNEAKKNVPVHHTSKIDLICADIEDLPFWNQTFHKACSINTIYFWRNPKKALAEVHRVLQPNGIFVLALRPFVKNKTLNFSTYGFKEYTTNDIFKLLKNSNFELDNVKTLNEPPVSFKEEMHELESVYYVLHKK
ncbi:class I SAM-dependent methyltransferase [uncultured Zobellia sp.]|uniref:class I SAM-dependent methyltransferase n=1 Tax=uncultured Zobellia sp. TaxID=255433 RepID=UPI00259742F1|nr:class I SAM-dependent methyltransferase [uncultured Zobellia sp.]